MGAGPSRPPVVGIAAHQVLVDESGFPLLHFAAAVPYVKAVRRSGAIPVILAIIDPDDRAELDSTLDAVDAVIVTGGCDVEPARYGAVPAPETGPLDLRRDEVELALCRALVERDQPTLCVCRGIQVLNVALGGTLVQHVPEHSRDDRYNDTVHHVTLDPQSRIAAALGRTTLGVNTLHHQIVDRLAERARAVGWADDGTVEAIEVDGAPHVLAVQWHPEMLRHRPEQVALFRQLFELA
jgi:gamma-glutamyl-gamma-aminobutyrate hydrolase PuuD